MDRSSLEKKNLGSMPAAQAAARSGSVDLGKDNLIQAKAHQPLISQPTLKQNQPRTTGKQAKQLLAINRSVVAGNKNSSSRLIQSKVNTSGKALSKSATNSSTPSVDTLNHIAQLKKESGFSVVHKDAPLQLAGSGKKKAEKIIPVAEEADPYEVDEAEVKQSDATAFDETAESIGKTADAAAVGAAANELGSSVVKAVQEGDDAALTSKHLNYDPETGAKRTPEEQKAWMSKHGHSEEDVEKAKAEWAAQAATSSSISATLGFMKLPSLWTKFKKSADSYEKFQVALEGADTLNKGVEAGAQIANAASGATDETAQSTAKISSYLGGIIGLVKDGYKAFMDVKEARKNYEFIKANQGKPEATNEKYIKFKAALKTSGHIMNLIVTYQKKFDGISNSPLAAAVPAISITNAAISIYEKYSFLNKDTGDIGKTGADAQNANILSKLKGLTEDQQKDLFVHLKSDDFHMQIKAHAGYRQQQRDNPEIFAKYEQSLESGAEAEKIKADLQRNFPRNYAAIEKVYSETQKSPMDLFADKEALQKLGMTDAILNEILEDQTLINQLEDIKGKRVRNAQFGIAMDLINIGGDIASLSGAAPVGAAMKAGAAAISAAKAGGNLVKSTTRGSGAKEFAAGAEKQRFLGRASLDDHSDILRSTKAKEGQYFASARTIMKTMQDHDTSAHNMAKQPSPADLKANKSSYDWTVAKIQSAGASVEMIKAMLNSGAKTGNDIVKYFIDKLKVR